MSKGLIGVLWDKENKIYVACESNDLNGLAEELTVKGNDLGKILSGCPGDGHVSFYRGIVIDKIAYQGLSLGRVPEEFEEDEKYFLHYTAHGRFEGTPCLAKESKRDGLIKKLGELSFEEYADSLLIMGNELLNLNCGLYFAYYIEEEPAVVSTG